MIMQVTRRAVLPDFEMAETMARQSQRMPASGFIAEARALAAKHATGTTTERRGGFTQDQKDIYQMTRIHRASRSW